MKTLRFALAAFGAGIASLTAAPRLFVSTPTLAPESGIELILDRAAVPDEAVGRPAENDWLDVTPALPGKLEWKAPNVARFLPDKPPMLGTTYQFSLRTGRKHLDQSPVPAGKIATVQSSPFQIEAAVTVDRYLSSYSPRTAVWLLRFNDDVDPVAAAPFFSFESKTGQRVAAKTQRATYGAAKKVGYDGDSWTRRFEKARAGNDATAEHADEEALPSAVLVTPLTPLPVGEDWKLAVLAGLPNTAANAKLTENTVRWVGAIEPFRVSSISADTVANQPRRVVVDFNLALPDPLPPAWLEQAIVFEPKPADLKAKVEGSRLTLEGDFATQDGWQFTLREPFASADGRSLVSQVTKSLEFERLEPSLALPTDEEAQLAAGSRRYRIETANLKEVNVRVKTLTGTDLVRAFQGYRHYTGYGPNETELKPTGPVPFELIAGTHSIEQSFPLDTKIDQSKEIVLEWDRLIPGAPKHGTFFLEATGTALEGSKTEVDGQTRSKPSVQAFVQLTDIGLAWKLSAKNALVYAFSCTTGEPLRGVKLDAFGEDAKPLQSTVTGADGLASLPRTEVARHLRASLGDDTFITAFDTGMSTVSLWRFPVRYSWEKPAESNRRVMVFTDRSLYRPGETIHLKGMIRTQRGNAIEAPDAAKPRLRLLDPTEQEVLNREITLSAAGAFDLDFTAPENEVGNYQIQVEWPEEVAKAEALDDDHYEEKERILGNARFEFNVRVDEFRRNAFELTQTIPEAPHGAAALQVDLAARYYQGQAVSEGKARHYSRVEEVNLYPERFRDFLFGDHKAEDWHYWFHYFNYKWDDQPERQTTAANGELKLDASGKTAFAVSLPQGDFPTAREISVSTEVTDANNQTLTTESKTTVHPAAVYVGVSRLDRLVRAGDRVPLKLVAVTPEGEPFDQPVTVETTLVREINEQSKTRNESGATVTRNDLREETIANGTVTLDPGANRGEGTEFVLAPTQTGKHFLTLKGKDAAGHSFATTATYYVYGSNEYPWAYEEGMKIKLVPEKKAYKPGETARVLVLSPIEGSALVTVERESVLRSFTVPLKADKPVIEIPLTDDDAPNAYVSVLVIKGSQDSARKFKEPQLRLGYCELAVENRRDRLAVSLSAENSTDTMLVSTAGDKRLPAYRPGEEVVISGKVTRADGSPAVGAEVTLYAEDEGTLAVMGYENPDPLGFFYNPRLLTVLSGTSLENFVSEDPDQQSFFNKGFFVGGGDEAADFGKKLRKDFNPCATWAPTLTVGSDGKFRHAFKLPDTLTRYRVLAIAAEGISRFGNTQTDIVVNKPVMLEPKTPRFANESDTLTPQVLVQNASPHAGTWRITFNPHTATGTPVCRALGETTQTVQLAAGASATVPFPIMIETTGEAVLTFRAEPVLLEGTALTPVLARKLSDSVEARFPVNYPMPLLRQTKLVKLEANQSLDLKPLLDPQLLEGKGTLDLEVSRSLLLEAAGSIDYLLSYPHGCVEQTTSSLMPWLAVEALKPYVPRFASVSDQKVHAAIQKGADRLLSMQLPTGGFTYWPGHRDRVDWATSYAGLGLLLARDAGANVPDSAVNGLCNDLTTSLRGLSDLRSTWDMESATRGLWVLSLAGKPQTSYHNLLRDRLEQLSPRSRCFLALAIADSEADNAQAEATAVLRSGKPFRAKDDSWMTYHPDDALNLLAWSRIEPGAAEATRSIDRMLRDRNRYGDWHTTWVNGWSLLALANYAESEETREEAIAIQVNDEKLTLDAQQPSTSRKFELGSGPVPSIQTDTVAYLRAKLSAKPKIEPQQPTARNGLEVTRFYERVKADGSIEPLDRPALGELIRVTLRVTLPRDDTRYVVIEDPLPAIFETVNSNFSSQRAASGIATSENNWTVSHSELRSDRAVFYVDRVWRGGTYHVTYLARCTVPGEAIAPVAKVESMYDPENFALSASRVFKTQ
jgi:uncharacterized protein YfaS (alpha-2-macroglobulin family)